MSSFVLAKQEILLRI